MKTRYHLTLKSSNKKTGPIPVSTTTSDTCPPSCGSFERCYAKCGPLRLHWTKVEEKGQTFGRFLKSIKSLPAGTLWRHNQAGDLPGLGDKLDGKRLIRLMRASSHTRGFTYTHKPLTDSRDKLAVFVCNMNPGFTVNLSADTLQEADEKAALGIGPVVVVLPANQRTNTTTPEGRKVVICPAVTHEGVTCATCKLCAWNERKVIIGFPAHGSLKNKLVRITGN